MGLIILIMAYTTEEQIEELQSRCSYLESALIDLMTIIVDNKDFTEDFAYNIGGDIQHLKKEFEDLISDF